MSQIRFSRCLKCGETYSHEVKSGYGPLYCTKCKLEVSRAKARERQRTLRKRRGGQ